MVTDNQVRILMKLINHNKTLKTATANASGRNLSLIFEYHSSLYCAQPKVAFLIWQVEWLHRPHVDTATIVRRLTESAPGDIICNH